VIAQEQEGASLTHLVRELTVARAKAASARHHLQVCNWRMQCSGWQLH